MDNYESFSTGYLIKQVQREALELRDPEIKKKLASKKYIQRRIELNRIRNSLIPRLEKEDNSLPTFFPIESRIEFKNPKLPGREWEPGIVCGWSGDKVLIRLKGSSYEMNVDPLHLKLSDIRTDY